MATDKIYRIKSKYGGTSNVRLEVLDYAKGGKALVGYDAEEGYPYAKFTSWMAGIPEGLVAMKTYSENEGFAEQLVALGVIEMTGESLSGFPLAKVLI